jgi:hypothetical protein
VGSKNKWSLLTSKEKIFLMENKDLPHMWKNPSHNKGLPKVLLT